MGIQKKLNGGLHRMKKVCAGDLSSFLKSHKLTDISSDVKEMMKIGCQLGYLYDDDIIYMAGAGVHAAQRRLTTKRRAG